MVENDVKTHTCLLFIISCCCYSVDLNLNSLLVKRQNDITSPGAVTGKNSVDLNLNSLLVKRQNDITSPGAVTGKN